MNSIPTALDIASSDIIDWCAALGRAEQIVEALRSSHNDDGWKVHKEGAERMLRYFRDRAAGRPDCDAKWAHASHFINSHGQSLDWILLADPRCMICELAPLRSAQNAARAESFRDLEGGICDLALMGRLAMDEAERVLEDAVGAPVGNAGYERATFAISHLFEMIEALKRHYYAEWDSHTQVMG